MSLVSSPVLVQMSYLQIKRFVDEQIKALNTPLILNDDIKRLLHQEGISEGQAQSILFKCNLLMKRHNRTKFNKQVVHQIVQQVAKAEQENLMQVNKALSKISRLAQPIMTDQFASSGRLEDRLRLLSNLADILPEGRYLFAVHGDNESESQPPDDAETQAPGSEDPNPLVRDDEELVQSPSELEMQNQYLKATKHELDQQIGAYNEKRDKLRQQYDDLRMQLAHLNEDIVYKMEKLAYLRSLNLKMDFLGARPDEKCVDSCDSDGDDEEEAVVENSEDEGLGPQMTRFSVLVEKLEFALRPG
ncbi:hypothetical protein METBIDRAFT_12594 [Metschnikowia bicuspidata var. bicuspidata NRRL YB-4993]|uniref:Uncharacterized protein n=1 Tax=Metschnikowia bicuspidata var. bicuspidata NRRL YB-4993 TaxID=869754 RepID=A0A1A0H9R2_9ASCO|nr:hypothetical protein METBIDRAFT_12594 [Metschnikowia bicuspidata var. bicuspidata NRRL YB-4993]OBA20622.1 hypothetical protein METBIDRAFT_12594 [Metschnikowia bicuspidata var. bicuspidata NRRL YB-4993]